MRKSIVYPILSCLFMAILVMPAKSQTETTQEEIYTFAEQMPQFPGKMEDMRTFIKEHLEYPAIAKENGIEGKVFIRFVVYKNGKIGQIEPIARKSGWGLEDEAIRVVGLMPDWMPAKQNGKPINCYYTLPITFQINKSKQ